MKKVLAILTTAVIFLLVIALCFGLYSYAVIKPIASAMRDHGDMLDWLDEEREDIQSKVEALQKAQASTEEEVTRLTEECEQLKEDLQQSKAEYEQLKEALQQSVEAREQLEEDLGQSVAEQESMEARLNALEKINQSTQLEIDRLESELASLKKQVSAPSDRIRIYIDQGHNPTSYHNSGSSGNGLQEQDVTFVVGCLLADLLRTDGRFEVQLSRPNKSVVLGTDNTSSLMARVNGAAAFNADYFISLHTNAYTSDTANGIEVFVARAGGESYVFGETLLDGLLASTNLKNRGMKLGPELVVLAYASMPAVLVEMGFISNSGDAALFAEHPELFAEGLYNGILNYFGLMP